MADEAETSWKKEFQNLLSSFFKRNLLPLLLILGAIIGTTSGILLRRVDMKENTKEKIGFMGELLIHALKSVCVPVIVGAVIADFGALYVKDCRKISLRILMYLLISKCFAAFLSVALCLLVRPGVTRHSVVVVGNTTAFRKKVSRRAEDKFMDIGRNLIPENWVEMFVSSYETQMVDRSTPESLDFVIVKPVGTNWLGILVVSLIIGMALSTMGEQATPLISIFSCVTDTCLIVTRWILWFVPIGIAFSICRDLLRTTVSVDHIVALAPFVGLIWSCCIAHILIIHPLIYFMFTQKNPYKVFLNFPLSFIVAVTTGFSSGTVPIAMKELIENQKVEKRLVHIVIPIGITINKDGAFYMYVIGSLFEADRTNRYMGIDLIVMVIILALTTSMATASKPNEGMALLIMMWSTLSFENTERDILLLYMIDFVTDRLRTLLNVCSNVFCVAVLDSLNIFDDNEETDQ